ncbi:hypothetical protein J056_004029 [Wallemia ichthyophaga EXF-994]|uniref:Isopenicillin N synthase-like Fe(2+) 2OG dioxygenase domain-containing protein n=1 Tax=Wallemia ichthyophaga (strain EXF-994 / CBS 113033) TaxID=1299270 RepID=R9AHZ1_WALI9|nr:uncharacterized protein J056_004029 [Wallemia ichthyophaga EXF-994]EOR01793.1 hypothetical protein J056_004029 [Wallemia ichthyophaga EXF-994]
MIPIIDLHNKSQEESIKAADGLSTYGVLFVRVPKSDNLETFTDMMEDYFDQPIDKLKADERPEHSYQVGCTVGIEKAKCFSTHDAYCVSVINSLEESERPTPVEANGDGSDLKCRFFHRMSTPDPNTQYATDMLQNITPADFKGRNWEGVMNDTGKVFLNAIEHLSILLAQGLGLPPDTFVDSAKYGNHLLAPTGSDLSKYGYLNSVLAGFHTDLNFLTIHGKSRFSGLSIWARNTGKKIPVSIPDGCYLVQAGKQLEHYTGGKILAGFHEVVVNDKTISQIENHMQQHPARPLIRVSSTFFYHLSSSLPLPEHLPKYPAMNVGDLVMNELKSIGLSEDAK